MGMAQKTPLLAALLLVLSLAATHVMGHEGSGELIISNGVNTIRQSGFPIEGPDGFLNYEEDGTVGFGGSSVWIVEKKQDGTYEISRVLQREFRLAPKFKARGVEPLKGSVGLVRSKTATWRITPDVSKRGLLITAARIPRRVTFPRGGRVYLTANNGTVSWKWSRGVPEGSLWEIFFVGE